MGSNDVPPPHVPSYLLPVINSFLQVCGSLWTISYILMVRESRRTKTYSMPLFALAVNFSWEIVYSLYVVESNLEFTVFGIWMLVDIGLVYYTLKYGREEWRHAPFVAKHLGMIFFALLIYCSWGQYAFARWWIDNKVGMKEGKFYKGVIASDTTELGFWSTGVAQTYLSIANLAQLLVRQHTGGSSWGIWATRTFGSIFGAQLYWGFAYYFWPAGHAYFMTPFAIFLWSSSLAADLVYPFVFYKIRKTEKTLPDGRKVRGDRAGYDTRKRVL